MDRYGSVDSRACSTFRVIPLLVAITLYVCYYILKGGSEISVGASDERLHPSQNRTLGFADILVAVVPSSTAEHFHHQLNTLSLASHHSGIDLRTFEGGGDKKYTKVWRGQMTMLRYVLEHKLETALILEGAVDWDPRIKDQLKLLSANLPDATIDRPYGLDWMAFWLGYCGEPAQDNIKTHALYQDESAASLSEPQQALFEVGARQRNVHEVQRSGCTVAYAVTQAGAKKILDEIGFEHVNLALDRDEVSSYQLPGLAVMPPLFGMWSSESSSLPSPSESYLDRSVRKALYDHD